MLVMMRGHIICQLCEGKNAEKQRKILEDEFKFSSTCLNTLKSYNNQFF